MKKLKPWLLIFVVFFAGVVVGVVGTRIAVRKILQRVAANPDLMRARIERDLASNLKLTPEQRAQAHDILVNSQNKIRELRSEFQPRFLEILNDAESQISEKLTPEQREKLQQFLKEKRKIWKPAPDPSTNLSARSLVIYFDLALLK